MYRRLSHTFGKQPPKISSQGGCLVNDFPSTMDLVDETVRVFGNIHLIELFLKKGI